MPDQTTDGRAGREKIINCRQVHTGTGPVKPWKKGVGREREREEKSKKGGGGTMSQTKYSTLYTTKLQRFSKTKKVVAKSVAWFLAPLADSCDRH